MPKYEWFSLLQNAMDSYYKLQQLFYYKVRQVLQSAMDLLQIATGIAKCDDYYKLRQYNVHLIYPLYGSPRCPRPSIHSQALLNLLPSKYSFLPSRAHFTSTHIQYRF